APRGYDTPGYLPRRREKYLCLRAAGWAPDQGGRLAASARVALAVEPAGAWGALCAAAGHQCDVWHRDPYRGQCAQGGAMLRDVPRHGHQRATADTGLEAAPLDRVLFSDLEALAGDGSLSGAERRGILRPLGTAPDGLFGVVLHLTRHLQRSTHDGRDYLQSQTPLALCGLRSS